MITFEQTYYKSSNNFERYKNMHIEHYLTSKRTNWVTYYKQSLRNKEPKKFIIDIFDNPFRDSYHRTKNAILGGIDEIVTDHICLVNLAYKQGYEIFIRDFHSKRSYSIRDLTDKELKPYHNIEKMLLANHFNSYFSWHF